MTFSLSPLLFLFVFISTIMYFSSQLGREENIFRAKRRNDSVLSEMFTPYPTFRPTVYLHIARVRTYIQIFCVRRRFAVAVAVAAAATATATAALIAYQRGRRATDGGIGRKAWRT